MAEHIDYLEKLVSILKEQGAQAGVNTQDVIQAATLSLQKQAALVAQSASPVQRK